jgi:hypothetical protein
MLFCICPLVIWIFIDISNIHPKFLICFMSNHNTLLNLKDMDPFFVPTFNLLKFTQMHNLIFFKLTPQPKEKSKLFLLLVLQA